MFHIHQLMELLFNEEISHEEQLLYRVIQKKGFAPIFFIKIIDTE